MGDGLNLPDPIWGADPSGESGVWRGVFASGGPRRKSGEDPLFCFGAVDLLSDEGGEFQAKASTVFDADGGMVMTGNDEGGGKRSFRQGCVTMMEEEAGLLMVSDEREILTINGPIVIPYDGDEAGDLGPEVG